jgi:hypothetical protein
MTIVKYDAAQYADVFVLLGARVSCNPDGSLVVWPIHPRGLVARYQMNPHICYTKAEVDELAGWIA